MFTLDLEGLDALVEQLTTIAETFPGEVGNALRAEAEIEMTESKKRVPVDTGALRASGHVVGPEQNGDEQIVTMGFGGPAGIGNQGGETNETEVGYAVPVHEDTEKFHPVGQDHYLSSVLLESIPYLPDRVLARMQRTRSGE